MDRVDVRLDIPGGPYRVGQLARHRGRILFEYDEDFLGEDLPLSPVKLPLRPGVFDVGERDFYGLPGLFFDSLPDGWGLLLMDRAFRQAGIDPEEVGVLGRLRYLSNRPMGALTYHPASELERPNAREVDLADLAAQARRIDAERGEAERVLDALLVAGGSPGGARPKVLVGVSPDRTEMVAGTDRLPAGWTHYLVKFGAEVDHGDGGPIEAAYADLARAAGLTMPDTHLFELEGGDPAFGVERFDRRGDERVHVHSVCGLLHASHRLPSMDYEGLLRLTLHLTNDMRQVKEAFRRMVFNVYAHNRDDHTKNTSYLMGPDGEWRLAPAYDLTFSSGMGGEHALSVAGEGRRPTRAHFFALSEKLGIDRGEAAAVVEEVREAVGGWEEAAHRYGVSERRIAAIGGRLATVGEQVDAGGPR